MPDTHINAFYADVDEAEAKVATAQAELQAAKDRLEIKKRQMSIVETVKDAPSPVVTPLPVKEDSKVNDTPTIPLKK